ncbi:MAG: hypothetical protein IT294_15360 [Deltaproteobacteria bacterium]|nr:hypothetical protein [Deltaproteobacteria bacterium]
MSGGGWRRRRVGSLVVATGLAMLGASATAVACPVCFVADERARQSFLATAVGLSALPFLLFAGIAYWLRRELARTAPRAGPAADDDASVR